MDLSLSVIPSVREKTITCADHSRPVQDEGPPIGLSEDEARAADYDVRVGKVPFVASGKAVGTGHTEGFVKIVSDARYGEILGCQAIGAGVTDRTVTGPTTHQSPVTNRPTRAGLANIHVMPYWVIVFFDAGAARSAPAAAGARQPSTNSTETG